MLNVSPCVLIFIVLSLLKVALMSVDSSFDAYVADGCSHRRRLNGTVVRVSVNEGMKKWI